MTTKRIIYTRPDGGVSIICPAPEFINSFDGTEAEAIAFIQAKDVPTDAIDIEVVEKSTTPIDRWFRNAWTRSVGGGPIDVDMLKAREIQVGKIHAVRQAEIARLWREEDRAQLAGRTADVSQHAATRETLETMNLAAVAASIAGAVNSVALRAVWPAGLPPQI